MSTSYFYSYFHVLLFSVKVTKLVSTFVVIIMPHARRKRNWNKQYYGKNRDELLAQRKGSISKDPEFAK